MSWRDRIRDTARLDAACELLRLVARELGDAVELHVRQDGRVEIRAIRGPFTRHIGRADLLPDGAEQMPSAELCDMLDGLRETGAQR